MQVYVNYIYRKQKAYNKRTFDCYHGVYTEYSYLVFLLALRLGNY